MIGLVRSALRTDDRVPDVACGTVTLALEAAEVASEVTGVDFVPNMGDIASAKSRERGAANLTVRVGTAAGWISRWRLLTSSCAATCCMCW